MNLPKKNINIKGFTLVELIISVGTLALLGVLILIFFMSSSDLSLRTEELDYSVYHTNNIIESIKLNRWEENPLKNFKIIDISNDNTILSSLYDKNWNPTNEENEALFRTNIILKEESENSEKSLYNLRVQVVRLKKYFRSEENNPEIHSVNTSLYLDTILEDMLK